MNVSEFGKATKLMMQREQLRSLISNMGSDQLTREELSVGNPGIFYKDLPEGTCRFLRDTARNHLAVALAGVETELKQLGLDL